MPGAQTKPQPIILTDVQRPTGSTPMCRHVQTTVFRVSERDWRTSNTFVLHVILFGGSPASMILPSDNTPTCGNGVEVCGVGTYYCYGFGGCDCNRSTQVFTLDQVELFTSISSTPQPRKHNNKQHIGDGDRCNYVTAFNSLYELTHGIHISINDTVFREHTAL